MTTANQSRRGFLAYLGLAGASTVATAAAPAAPSPGHFEHPAEYLAAMQAIGWQPKAMFHWLPDGGVHCMGVNESAADEETVSRTWRQFHAIQMRAPAQVRAEDGGWWREVWQHLYDLGFREDVTPPKARARMAALG